MVIESTGLMDAGGFARWMDTGSVTDDARSPLVLRL